MDVQVLQARIKTVEKCCEEVRALVLVDGREVQFFGLWTGRRVDVDEDCAKEDNPEILALAHEQVGVAGNVAAVDAAFFRLTEAVCTALTASKPEGGLEEMEVRAALEKRGCVLVEGEDSPYGVIHLAGEEFAIDGPYARPYWNLAQVLAAPDEIEAVYAGRAAGVDW